MMLLDASDAPTLETTISFGNLLTIASFLVFAAIYVANTKNIGKVLETRLQIIDATMDDFKIEIKKLNEVITKQALQDARVSTMDERLLAGGKRIDELSEMVHRLLVGTRGRE